jgi:3-isopropylmalate dehydrogenase
VGPEVAAQVRRIIEWLQTRRSIAFDVEEDLIGGAAYQRYGSPLAEDTLAKAVEVGCVVMGAVGGPQFAELPYNQRPEAGLLRLRAGMGLFANLRPARCFDSLLEASTLKSEVLRGVDLMIVRELTGGVYFGEPRGILMLADGDRRAVNSHIYTTAEIKRVAEVAFSLSRQRTHRVVSVDKSNVMEAGILWREEVQKLHDEKYPDVQLSHMYADNCAMQLVRRPIQFDVILTDNLFGDILSDEAAMLTGSLGMLPSASLGSPRSDGSRAALYEPIHGSAPDIAGQGIANPIATLLSFALALRYSFQLQAEAQMLENAIEQTVAAGFRTADIMQKDSFVVGTVELTSQILSTLETLAES